MLVNSFFLEEKKGLVCVIIDSCPMVHCYLGILVSPWVTPSNSRTCYYLNPLPQCLHIRKYIVPLAKPVPEIYRTAGQTGTASGTVLTSLTATPHSPMVC